MVLSINAERKHPKVPLYVRMLSLHVRIRFVGFVEILFLFANEVRVSFIAFNLLQGPAS